MTDRVTPYPATASAPEAPWADRTARLDLWRSGPAGFLQACGASFFLLIAVKRFDASANAKSAIAAAGGFGMLLSPWLVAIARRRGRASMSTAAVVLIAGSVGVVGPLVLGSLAVYVVGAVLAIAATEAITPLVTSVYQRNYPAHERGRRVARMLMLRVAVTAIAGIVVGATLKRDIGRYRVVLIGALGALLISALLLARMPSAPLPRQAHERLLPDFSLLRTDRLLRVTLAAWMFMGIGNLMMIPLRVEYLANERYGVGADAGRVALLTVTVPAVVRVFCTPFFGWVFDRMSFFVTRIAINAAFAFGILTFFTGTSRVGLIVGSIIHGVAVSGGDVMWTLWVTKFSPPDRVADYMSLHTFSTGIRAVAAPFLAYRVIESFSVGAVAGLAAALIAIASLMLVPEARREHHRRSD